MHEKIGPSATWIVPDYHAAAYFKAGAPDVITDRGRNVSAARNIALELAFSKDVPCLLLDDDLIDCNLYMEPDMLIPITFKGAVWEVCDRLEETGLKLAATTHVTNPLFLKPGFSIKSAINGGCLLIKPNPLRFDESIRLSEDVDYAIQHVIRFGGAMRLNDVVLRFKRLAPGGVQDYRNEDERLKSMKQLMDKWPGIVLPSKKDPAHPVVRVASNRIVLS
jgi:hypothetical protein